MRQCGDELVAFHCAASILQGQVRHPELWRASKAEHSAIEAQGIAAVIEWGFMRGF
jgi:hypothetical protein